MRVRFCSPPPGCFHASHPVSKFKLLSADHPEDTAAQFMKKMKMKDHLWKHGEQGGEITRKRPVHRYKALTRRCDECGDQDGKHTHNRILPVLQVAKVCLRPFAHHLPNVSLCFHMFFSLCFAHHHRTARFVVLPRLWLFLHCLFEQNAFHWQSTIPFGGAIL